MKVRLTRHAEADLVEVADFIADDSPSLPVEFIEELYKKCITLAEMPEAFPLAPRYEALGVRRRLHGDYLILYTVRGATITVLRIIQGARDNVPLLLQEPKC